MRVIHEFEVFHPEVLKYKNTSVINTTFNIYTIVNLSGRHVSTSLVIFRPSKKTDPRAV